MITRSEKHHGFLQQYCIFAFTLSSADVKSCHIQESCTNISFDLGWWTDTGILALLATDDLKIYLTLKISEHSLLSSAIQKFRVCSNNKPWNQVSYDHRSFERNLSNCV